MNNESEQCFLLTTSSNQPSTAVHKVLSETPETTQLNLENVENFTNVCRICATITEFIMPIFAEEGLQNNLADKINKHLPIQVFAQDMLPLVVCYQCASTLLAWHELVACCQQADAALRACLPRVTRARDPQEADSATTHQKSNTEDEIQNKDAHSHAQDLDLDFHCYDFDSDQSDNEPLSKIAGRKRNNLYSDFYKALANFRDHYFDKHEDNYSDLSECSTSADEDNTVHNYDDLTLTNMRRGKLDHSITQELDQMQTRINGKVYYTCKICGKNLSSRHTYVFHRRIHTGEKPCVCHICGKQFRVSNGLQRHLTETHERIKRYSCKLCPKTFANTQNLRQHIRIHTGERPFVCAHCGKRFRQRGSLHVHIKTHTEQFPHQCGDCGEKFRLRAGLVRHKLKHTGERAHRCSACGKTFRQRYELNNHQTMHSDSKPFACAVCGASFKQRRTLRHHIKKVHENIRSAEGSRPLVYHPGPF